MHTMISSGATVCARKESIAVTKSSHRSSVYAHTTAVALGNSVMGGDVVVTGSSDLRRVQLGERTELDTECVPLLLTDDRRSRPDQPEERVGAERELQSGQLRGAQGSVHRRPRDRKEAALAAIGERGEQRAERNRLGMRGAEHAGA